MDVCSESYLVYVFGMATVLGVQILLRLVSAGLATILAHHVEDLYHKDIQRYVSHVPRCTHPCACMLSTGLSVDGHAANTSVNSGADRETGCKMY